MSNDIINQRFQKETKNSEFTNQELASSAKKGKRTNSIDLLVSKKIQEFRIDILMSQVELSKLIGVSVQQVQKYENGKNRVSAGRLYDLAKAFKVNITDFFDSTNLEYDISKISKGKESINMLKYFYMLDSAQRNALVGFLRAVVMKSPEKEKDGSGRVE